MSHYERTYIRTLTMKVDRELIILSTTRDKIPSKEAHSQALDLEADARYIQTGLCKSENGYLTF